MRGWDKRGENHIPTKVTEPSDNAIIPLYTSSREVHASGIFPHSALLSLSLVHVNLVLQSPLIPQFGEALQGLSERNQLAHLLGGLVVPVADVDGAGFLFLGADDFECPTGRVSICSEGRGGGRKEAYRR